MTLKDFESHQYIPNVLTATAMSRAHTAEKSFQSVRCTVHSRFRPWMYHKTSIGDGHPILSSGDLWYCKNGAPKKVFFPQTATNTPRRTFKRYCYEVFLGLQQLLSPRRNVAPIFALETQKLCLRKQDGRIPGLVPHPPHLRHSQG